MEYHGSVLSIGGVSIEELTASHGTPLYVYDASVIRAQIRRVERAFAGRSIRPFYAMKANSNVSILSMFAEAGFGCDAVSPGEILLARAAGFEGSDIWFTCSNVSDEDLRFVAVEPRVIINLNSFSELERVVSLGIRNKISLRVNTEVGAGHHKDVVTGGFGVKFGFEIEDLPVARREAADAGLKITGLHAHIGSGIESIDPLLESARRLIELSGDFPHLEVLNFGGGLSVPYRPGEQEFPIDEYGAALTGLMREVLRDRGISGIIEPGRYLVAASGSLITRVTARRLSHEYTWIGCDTGFNHLVRPSRYGAYHHILNGSRGSDDWLRTKVSEEWDPRHGVLVAGNLCESGDLFTREGDELRPRPMPETAVGDLLVFCDTGAYGFSMGSHYNSRPMPAEILIDDGKAEVIRSRQPLEALLEDQPHEEKR
ncbi:MAG: diaminopimelate decarboxylase [Acidobacteria bacterium]|nr:diaminopimelate decarboxylase [Acidobacteriota bacterium]